MAFFLRNLAVVIGISISPVLLALKVGDTAPNFNLELVNTDKTKKSEKRALSDYKGKVVYLDFWASWCSSCRKAFPLIDQLQAQYKDNGFVVLAVNEDDNKQLAEQFLLDNKVRFISLFDEGGKVATSYQLKGMPSSFLIDRKGKISAVHVGFNTSKGRKIKQQIQALVKQP